MQHPGYVSRVTRQFQPLPKVLAWFGQKARRAIDIEAKMLKTVSNKLRTKPSLFLYAVWWTPEGAEKHHLYQSH